jgi:hypothetical protein
VGTLVATFKRKFGATTKDALPGELVVELEHRWLVVLYDGPPTLPGSNSRPDPV